MPSFVELRKDDWHRLERYIERLSGRRARLTPDEFREFNRLYRRAAADLAIAREDVRDERVSLYLNHLIVRAHGLIYRTEEARLYNILAFYRHEFPAAVRKCLPYVLAAFLVFLLAGGLSFVTTYMDESFSSLVAPGMKQRVAQKENWTQNIVGLSPIASSGIMINNITVTFLTFALGITAGVGTLMVLALNGLSIGSIVSLCVKYKFTPILTFAAAHGVIELTAIFIAGGAGLLIGKALLVPDDLTRRQALVVNGRLAIKLILGCIPMLIIAGLIEGFLSPSSISPYYKFAVAILSAVALLLYFSGLGRTVENAGGGRPG
jgi:uncharacterized membrane protein SpoIIM required for sporulation